MSSPPTTPNPSSREEGSAQFPSLDKEGLGVVDLLHRSFVFIDILALFRRYCSSRVEKLRSEQQFPDL